MQLVNKSGRTSKQVAVMAWLCLLVPISGWAAHLNVLVVLSDNSPPYLSFANTLTKNLPASIQATVLEHPEAWAALNVDADLIVTVGMKATEAAAVKSSAPLIAVMVPKLGYETLLASLAESNRVLRSSAIYLNQPWERQLDFMRAALPGRHKIGLLYAPDTRLDLAGMRVEIDRRGAYLIAQPVHSAEKLFSSLERVLQDCDVLLAIPDGSIYSSSNVRNILLGSYRRGVPLIGFSQSFVNAGALGAIFSTPEQLAEQTAATLVEFVHTARLPASQYPQRFSIALNQQVAHSMGIELSTSDEMRARMAQGRRIDDR